MGELYRKLEEMAGMAGRGRRLTDTDLALALAYQDRYDKLLKDYYRWCYIYDPKPAPIEYFIRAIRRYATSTS